MTGWPNRPLTAAETVHLAGLEAGIGRRAHGPYGCACPTDNLRLVGCRCHDDERIVWPDEEAA